MTRRVRIKGVRREQIDDDKLALAFLLLAKELYAEQHPDEVDGGDRDSDDQQEATV